jgi:hypothetical protein
VLACTAPWNTPQHRWVKSRTLRFDWADGAELKPGLQGRIGVRVGFGGARVLRGRRVGFCPSGYGVDRVRWWGGTPPYGVMSIPVTNRGSRWREVWGQSSERWTNPCFTGFSGVEWGFTPPIPAANRIAWWGGTPPYGVMSIPGT